MTDVVLGTGPALLLFLLDESGSMGGSEGITKRGFDAFFQAQKAVPADCRVEYVSFHSARQPEKKFWLSELPKLGTAGLPYCPRGGTALNATIGETIERVESEMANLPAHERPEKVFMVIQTDGGDGTSSYNRWANYRVLRAQVKVQESKGWGFLFMGMNHGHHVWSQANEYGFKNVIAYGHETTVSAFAEAAMATITYRIGGEVACGFVNLRKAEDKEMGF